MPAIDSQEATVIIGQPVKPGAQDAYAAWQDRLNQAATKQPGFCGVEVTRPSSVQADWTIVYRFDTLTHLHGWLNSPIRSELLEEGQQYFAGPPTQQVLGREDAEAPLLTVVVSHRVAPDKTDEFIAWQDRITAVQRTYDGFRGCELFRPIEGLQDEWTVLFRFDTAEHLDAWLVSDDRERLLAESEFNDFELKKIDNSFGNWFSFDTHGNPAPPPTDVKSAIVVWAGLYPTVVFLTLTTSPLKMPLWLGMLVGNLLSSFAMSFFTMPYYANKLFGWWLRPAPDAPQPATNVKGIALVLGINLAWAIVFIVMTQVLWTLP